MRRLRGDTRPRVSSRELRYPVSQASSARRFALVLSVCLVGVGCLLAGRAFAWLPAAMGPPRAAIAEPAAAAPLIRGYPLVLSSGASGAVWYGGAANGGKEYVEQLGLISPANAFLDLELTPELSGYWPQYFAPGADGQEWFLADRQGTSVPLLVDASPLGVTAIEHLAVDPSSSVRGLAVGADGNLWMTDTRLQGTHRVSAILRLTPSGSLTAFSRGLDAGAIPANITAGPDGSLWFTDEAGRIGRITTVGVIHEFRLPRQISHPGRPFAPSQPIIEGPDRALWFILGSHRLGRMTTSGRLRIFTPHSSYRGFQASGEYGELVGLAAAPDGDVWFTRQSGEVARIDRTGRVTTVTDTLLAAYGIAFIGGTAWIGEGPAYSKGEEGGGGEGRAARVARITASGSVRQFPPRPPCRVPSLAGVGQEFITPIFGISATTTCEGRLEYGRITIGHRSGPGQLVVVWQSPRAGTLTDGYLRIDVHLARVSPFAPRGTCRVPWPYSALKRSPRLDLWVQSIGAEEATTTYFGCLRPHGPTRIITRTVEQTEYGESLTHLVVASPFVAFTVSNGGKYGGGEALETFDLRTGRPAFKIVTEDNASDYSGPAGELPLPALERLGRPTGRGVRTYVLDAHGDVAWVGSVPQTSTQPKQLVLYLRDRSGTHRVAMAHEVHHLAFRGSRLTWIAEGTAHSTCVRVAPARSCALPLPGASPCEPGPVRVAACHAA